MTIQEDARRKSVYHMGYQHGVYDHNRGNQPMLGIDKDFGSLYVDGYNKGLEDAKKRKWYVVSIDDRGKVQHWYVKGADCNSINSWVETKEEATGFQTEEEAREVNRQLANTLGRGSYTVLWR